MSYYASRKALHDRRYPRDGTGTFSSIPIRESDVVTAIIDSTISKYFHGWTEMSDDEREDAKTNFLKNYKGAPFEIRLPADARKRMEEDYSKKSSAQIRTIYGQMRKRTKIIPAEFLDDPKEMAILRKDMQRKELEAM
jgi:hypothetical protein